MVWTLEPIEDGVLTAVYSLNEACETTLLKLKNDYIRYGGSAPQNFPSFQTADIDIERGRDDLVSWPSN